MRQLPNSEQASGSGASPSITLTFTRCWFGSLVTNVRLTSTGRLAVARNHDVVDRLAGLGITGRDAQAVRVHVLLLHVAQQLANALGQLARLAAKLGFENGGVDRGALGHRRVRRKTLIRLFADQLLQHLRHLGHQRRAADQHDRVELLEA